MIKKIEDPPDINIFSEFPHGKADDVLGIGAVAKEIHPTAERLKHRVGHFFPEKFQLEKRIDLLAENIP